MLALLLLVGGLMPARVCNACPADAEPVQDACCGDAHPTTDTTPDQTTPAETPDELPAGCDCPLGCCAMKAFQAVSMPNIEARLALIGSPWLVAADTAAPQPPVQGPRRPPRS